MQAHGGTRASDLMYPGELANLTPCVCLEGAFMRKNITRFIAACVLVGVTLACGDSTDQAPGIRMPDAGYSGFIETVVFSDGADQATDETNGAWNPGADTDGTAGGADTSAHQGDDGAPPDCSPDCTGRICGDDGCGGSCGACGAGTTCDAGVCVGSVPGTWSCALSYYSSGDGCHCECGAYDPDCSDGTQAVINCAPDQVCNLNGHCEGGGQGGCTPDCAWKECGPDGCGGVCGTCALGETCDMGLCGTTASGAASCAGRCGEYDGFQSCQCDDQCFGNDDCCADVCGQCGELFPWECGDCTPDCAGKACGDDSCGGSCGVCGWDESCQGGQCVADPVETSSCADACGGYETGASCQCDTNCFSYGDCCADICDHCAAEFAYDCGVCAPDCAGKACGDDGCGGSCGTCPAGEGCDAGQCVADVTDAWTCNDDYYDNDDGCDCDCGAYDPDCDDPDQTLYGCNYGEACDAQGQCESTCSPDCAGKACGDDGCGGSCGVCAESESCEDGQCKSGPAEGWGCSAAYYDSDDGCDCDCGAYDPDCDDPAQTLYGCEDGEACNAEGLCESTCSPDCGGRACGGDGCGGSCGDCAEGESCEAGQCVGDLPASWSCSQAYYAAGDGCDCDCGAYDPDCDDPSQTLYGCGTGEACNDQGECVLTCTPDCAGKACGGDGCGGSCGDCPSGEGCLDGQCASVDLTSCEGRCGVYDGDAPCQCDTSCVGLGDCCDDICEVCADEFPAGCDWCVADCAGKSCGDDGCGGSCGSCDSGQWCDGGQCAAGPPPSWTCNSTYYDAEDGCDCECGAYDPDCDDPFQTTWNCGIFEYCGDDGLCHW